MTGRVSPGAVTDGVTLILLQKVTNFLVVVLKSDDTSPTFVQIQPQKYLYFHWGVTP